MAVPTATSLQDIYTDDALAVQQKRWDSLLSQFKRKYGHQADFVARSPGRVNVIGEVRTPLRNDGPRREQANSKGTFFSMSAAH
jgi:hypothetical protein